MMTPKRTLLRLVSNLAAGATFDPSITCSAGYPTPQWTVTHPNGTIHTTNTLTTSFTIQGTGTTRCELGPPALLPYITALDASLDGLTGEFTARDLALLPNLQDLRLQSNASLVGRFSLADLGSAMTYFRLSSTSSVITGSLADLKAAMLNLLLDSTSSVITGSLADLKAAMVYINLASTGSVITGGATQMAALTMTYLNFNSCASMSQANVDDVALRLYTDRAAFTGATLAITSTGTTPDPSGVYQNTTPPVTGLERVYKLVVDPDNDHDKVFTWSY